ncbi:MAG: glycoside hydrolase family 16 protein [Phycisphaerales bacterium]
MSWTDEFVGDQLDTTKWGYRNLGPRRDAINIADAVAVEDGNLVIRTYTSGAGASMQHYTGMIGTQGLFQQKYGYFEARIDFDGRPGMWSAFWVQSPTMGNPIGDPGTAGAEIDIMEHRVINGSGADFQNVAHHALHWDGYGADHKSQNKDTAFPDLADGFHLYGLEWSPTGYRYYVDGQLTWTINQGVSHRDEYLILSSEVQDKQLGRRCARSGLRITGDDNSQDVVD